MSEPEAPAAAEVPLLPVLPALLPTPVAVVAVSHEVLQRRWRIARWACGVAFVAFFITTMAFRMHNAWLPFSLHGDQHQSIGHFWRYAIPGAIPKGHLLSDYANAYHSPPLWWMVMASMSYFMGPLTAAKITGLLGYLFFSLGAVIIVGRKTDYALGFLVGILVMRNPPDFPEQITGGMARCMAPALLYLFLFAWGERKHKLALVTLVLQAGIYPAVVIPCGLAYGAYCVLKGPMRDRVRRCAGMFIAGLLIIALGESQNLSTPKWWGDTVTEAQADKMPAWHAGGRFPELPHRTLANQLNYNITRSYKNLGHTPMPEVANRFVDRHERGLFIYGPGILALLLALLGMVRRPFLGVKSGKHEIPWAFIFTFISSCVAWWLVRFFAFKLFLPSRQIAFTVQYLVVTGVPWLVWWGLFRLWPHRRARTLVVTALITVLPFFLFRGDGFALSGAGYSQHENEAPMLRALRALPLDQEIACDIHWCESMMPLGQHVPYAARNLSHPLRPGYYNEAERRLVEMMRVLHATKYSEISDFVAKEHVRYFVYDTGHVSAVDTYLYHPAFDKVKANFARGGKSPRLLLNPPKGAVLKRVKNSVLLDLTKFVEPPAPVLGPVEEKDAKDAKDATDATDPTSSPP